MTEFSGLVPLLGHLQVEAGMLLAEHASLVRSRAAATLAGTAPAELPKVHEPAPAPRPEPVATVRVFALQNIKWRENGKDITCERYGDADLPIPLAEKARASKLVIDPNSTQAGICGNTGRACLHPCRFMNVSASNRPARRAPSR